MACTGEKLSALTFAPDLAPTDLFYMAEDLGGGIFFERKVELSQLDARYVLASAGTPPFTDSISLVKGSADATKLLRFEVDGFTAGTTRILTPQDADYTIAGLETPNIFTVNQTFSSTVSLSDGTAAAPSLRFTNEPTSGIFRDTAGEIGVATLGVKRAEFTSDGLNLGLNSLTFSFGFGSAPRVYLTSDGDNNLDQRNGLNGQQYHLYNTWSNGGLDFERVNFEWNANNAFLSTEQSGTGLFRSLALGSEGDATVSLRTNATNWFTVLGTGTMQGTLGVKTASTPIFDLTQTWSNAGIPFTAFKQNITDNGSAAGSLLLDMQVNSATVLSLGKTGIFNFADGVRQTFNPGGITPGFNFGSTAGDPITPINGDVWYESISNQLRFRINGATVSFSGDSVPPFTDTNSLIKGSADPTKLLRFEVDGFTAATTRVLTPQNADYIIAGTNIANTFSVSQTFSPAVNTSAIIGSGYSLTGSSAVGMIDYTGTWNTSGTPTALKLNISSNTSNAASLLIDLQAVSLTKFNVSALGMTTLTRVNSSATLNLTDPHLLFNNTSSQSMMVFAFSGTARGGLRADSSGNFSWHASGSQGHQFYSGTTAIDANCICGFSASGVVIGHPTAGSVSVARLDVISKATGNIGQILKEFAGQTENMLQQRNSSNTILSRLTVGGGFVFNENAADVDCRIEGDTDANLFFTDASTDRVGIGIATPLAKLHVAGGFYMATAGALSIASGTDQRAGNAVLVAGTVTVNNTTVTANTIVMLTRKTAGGTVGTLITYTVAAGTSFTINSDSALDTSTFSYMLIEVP